MSFIVTEMITINAEKPLDSVIAVRRVGNVASFGPFDPRWSNDRQDRNVEEILMRRERYLLESGQIDKLLGA